MPHDSLRKLDSCFRSDVGDKEGLPTQSRPECLAIRSFVCDLRRNRLERGTSIASNEYVYDCLFANSREGCTTLLHVIFELRLTPSQCFSLASAFTRGGNASL